VSVFDAPAFDGHELISYHFDPISALRAIIAIHSSKLGFATGGCRMYPYANDEAALDDVLRLSRGMSYKSALAGLPLGGGKAVIIGDPRRDKTPILLRAMGRFVNSFNGRFVTAEDSGISPLDVSVMAEETPYVAGYARAGREADPSPYTALGVFLGLESAVKQRLGKCSLVGVSVAVQGVGAVGIHLVRRLIDAGAAVQVCDIFPDHLQQARALGATIIHPEHFVSANVDVLVPCAMGGVFSVENVPLINAVVIAGSANNQLKSEAVDFALAKRNILYIPDFVVNAGGIIKVYVDRSGDGEAQCHDRIAKISSTLEKIYALARSGYGTQEAAEKLALEILRGDGNTQLAVSA
jgi:leucine dehydrogenase